MKRRYERQVGGETFVIETSWNPEKPSALRQYRWQAQVIGMQGFDIVKFASTEQEAIELVEASIGDYQELIKS